MTQKYGQESERNLFWLLRCNVTQTLFVSTFVNNLIDSKTNVSCNCNSKLISSYKPLIRKKK